MELASHDHLVAGLNVFGAIPTVLKMDLQEVGGRGWTGSMWLRIGTGGGHL